jgi:hypothetical protein
MALPWGNGLTESSGVSDMNDPDGPPKEPNDRSVPLAEYELAIDRRYANRLARATVVFTVLSSANQFAICLVGAVLTALFLVLAIFNLFLPRWESGVVLLVVVLSVAVQLGRGYSFVLSKERIRIAVGDVLQSAFGERSFALKSSELKLRSRYADIRKLTIRCGFVFLENDSPGYLLGLPLEIFPRERVAWVASKSRE